MASIVAHGAAGRLRDFDRGGWRPGDLTGLRKYLAAAGFVAAGAGTAEILYRSFETTRLSMVFLASVLICAVTLGARAALFAALLAFSIYNFYLVEPRFTFTLGTPEDILTLIVFLAVALLTGGLAGRVRDEAQRSKARARTTAVLFQASRELSSTVDEAAIRQTLVERMAGAVKGEAFLHDQGRTWITSPGEGPPQGVEDFSRNPNAAGMATSAQTIRSGQWRYRAMVTDGVALGVAGWRGSPSGLEPDAESLIQVMVDVGAAAIARARLSAVRSEAEALARTEKLRSALLSSVSHDLRTPLTAILVSAGSLRQLGERMAPIDRDDLLLNIEEEAERLNRYVVNLLNLTRLEGGALSVALNTIDVAEVVDACRRRFDHRLAGRTIQVETDGGPFSSRGDAVLLEQALANVIENAIRFAPIGSAIGVQVRNTLGEIVISIIDGGQGVAPEDQPRIFEKFFRVARSTPSQNGTGLGLSISKGLIEAMGGAITARNRTDGSSGLEVIVRMPSEPALV